MSRRHWMTVLLVAVALGARSPASTPLSPTVPALEHTQRPSAPIPILPVRPLFRAASEAQTGATCAISWQPNALAPVFHGVREYGTSTGAPGRVRVYFPSIQTSPWTASMLLGCGRYPVVVFAHGCCPGDDLQYQKWGALAAHLARAGYVVAVAQLPNIGSNPTTNTAAQQRIIDVVTWLRQGWVHRGSLMPPPATALIGHSYGAVIAGVVATRISVRAYGSLSGAWNFGWTSADPPPPHVLSVPQFYAWGTDELVIAGLDSRFWSDIGRPKHRVLFEDMMHWDYLGSASVPCESNRGPCPYTGVATTDLVTMFLGNYLPPELSTSLPGRIPDTLSPPTLSLTIEQQAYASGYLVGIKRLSASSACAGVMRVTQELEMRTVPYVLYMGQTAAADRIRSAGLVPAFTGPTGPGIPWVGAQSPISGQVVPFGSTVTMRLDVGIRP